MADASTPTAPPSRLPLLLGLVLGLAGAGGGFMATRMGLLALPGGETSQTDGHDVPDDHTGAEDHMATEDHATTDDGHGATSGVTSFVPLDPLVVNIADPSGRRFLRFVAQIETTPAHAAAIEAQKPRFADVLNGYLRAVDLADLEGAGTLDLLRGQMLRRLQTVAGDDAIHDLLIVEFVLN